MPNANQKKVHFILIYMLKQQITPKKLKNQCQFFRHVTNGIQFSYASLQANAKRVKILDIK